jgi:hypothetical protein
VACGEFFLQHGVECQDEFVAAAAGYWGVDGAETWGQGGIDAGYDYCAGFGTFSILFVEWFRILVLKIGE